MCSFDDEDDEAEMNSSCGAVSQILLSLEGPLPSSSRLPVPQPTATLYQFDSQSTVDGATVNNRLSAALDDHDLRLVTDRTHETLDDSDETQYVEPVCVGQHRSSACVDESERQSIDVTMSAENSPSLLDTGAQLLQFMSTSSGGATMQPPTTMSSSTGVVLVQPTTTTMSSTSTTAVMEPADLQVRDVDGPMTQDVETVSVPAACSVNESHLTLLQSSLDTDDDDDQLSSGTAASSHVTLHSSTAVSSHHHSATCVEISSNNDCLSAWAHTACSSPPGSASHQVELSSGFFAFNTHSHGTM